MALIKCKSCGSEVSSKAYSCPHCGHPMRKSPSARLAQGCGGIVMMAIGVVILIIMGAAVGVFK